MKNLTMFVEISLLVSLLTLHEANFVTANEIISGKLKENSSHGTSGLVFQFVSVQLGCGRLKNRLLTTNNGEKFCARYRDNEEFIQGEYFSYLTSVLFETYNVPTVYPIQVTINSSMWSNIWIELEKAGWKANAVVTLTPWIEDLRPVTAPMCIQLLTSCDNPGLRSSSDTRKNFHLDKQGKALSQWADLIVFDYITGNVDRLVSHLYNEKWDVKSLARPVHNLATSKGNLVLLDNESGFEHSYRLLPSYQHFHERLLRLICIFNNQTRTRIEKLADSRDLAAQFGQVTTNPHLIPFLTENTLATLKHRLERVLNHLQSC